MRRRPPVEVVIPVYDGVDFVRNCIESVLRHTGEPHQVRVIDDASPSSRTRELLRCWDDHPRVRVARNESNLGFVRSANRGFVEAGQRDVVLLNSDTVVTPGWLEGLADCAYSSDRIGTCSPLTSYGSIFAVPDANASNDVPAGWTIDDVAVAVSRLTRREYPETPTSHGFCMYVKRAFLDDVGLFDDAAFGLGYGEENDLCLRGRERGWAHLVDDATYVWHRGSMSFSERKEALHRAHRSVIDERYPYYTQLVRGWIEVDPLRSIRERLRAAFRGPPLSGRRHGTVLVLVHSGKGGVHHTTRDLVGALAPEWDTWVLTSNRSRLELERHLPGGLVEARSFRLEQPVQLIDLAHREYRGLLERVLDEVSPDVVHVRHLLAHSPVAIDAVSDRGVPIVWSFHDHYTICPTIHLIDNRGRFCEGHCNDDVEDCPLGRSWFPAQPRLKHNFLPLWRREMARCIEQVDVFVTTSEATKAIHERHFPRLREKSFEVIEHGRETGFMPPVQPKNDGVLRVVAFGAFNYHKGLTLLEELAAELEGRAIEIHLAGNTSRPVSDLIVHHGPYERDALHRLLAEIGPDLALIPSIMSETYCHTLTEAWAMGLPVVATDRGALRERIVRWGGGWLFSPHDTSELERLLSHLKSSPDEVRARRREVEQIQHRTIDEMAADYERIYQRLTAGRDASARERAPDELALAEARAVWASIEPPGPITGRQATKALLYRFPPMRRIIPWVMKRYARVRR